MSGETGQSVVKSHPSPFAGWACSHLFYDFVFEWLMKRIFGLSEPAVLLVVGPTGVGKSTLIQHLQVQLAHRLMAAMQANPSLLHKVYAEAVYMPSRGFDWDGLFTSLLIDANEILIDRKVAKVWPPEKPNLRGLAAAVNAMLLHHAPPACIIDEGGAFLESDSDESLKKIIEYLKSLGNRSRTHIVIFGDYRLAKMMEFNGQLNRRCQLIHFSNYPEGYEDKFDSVVTTFEARLRNQRIKVNLQGDRNFLFSETCGCVGLLKQWLENAWLAVADTDRILDLSVMQAEKFPVGSLMKWRSEIASGHEAVRQFIEGPSQRQTNGQL